MPGLGSETTPEAMRGSLVCLASRIHLFPINFRVKRNCSRVAGQSQSFPRVDLVATISVSIHTAIYFDDILSHES